MQYDRIQYNAVQTDPVLYIIRTYRQEGEEWYRIPSQPSDWYSQSAVDYGGEIFTLEYPVKY